MATQTLDPLSLPLSGTRLIEASAGTGKTYTIAGLYVRLLLGDSQRAPLSCEQILVVTFTNAATQELRDRIRKKIQLAYRAFLGMAVDDPLINTLYDEAEPEERSQALKRFDLALKSLDEAAIFTIHGFCQRILSDMAFESSLLFESEFTLDDSEYLHHAVRDFWREACYPLPGYLAQIIANKFSDPDGLTKQLRPLLGANQANVLPQPEAFSKVSERLTQSLARLRLIWPRERDGAIALLKALPLNGTRFGKKDQGYPKLETLFAAMDNWAAQPLSLPDNKVLGALALSGLKLNKGGEIPTPEQAPLLAHIEHVAQTIETLIPSFLYGARDGIKARFAAQKQLKNLRTPDDLLIALADALSDESDNERALASAIARRFPIALIDEFQDTDPLQYQIFSRIYQRDATLADNDLGLLMIGDPKQAIYAFRGADIHTYIHARGQTENHYSLDTNYRSSRAMVEAVNQLFSRSDDPFISQAIPFEIIKPSPMAAEKRLTEKVPQSSALRLKLLSEDPNTGLNKASARSQLAEDAANEIARLLNEAERGECLIKDRPLKAKDIAVLVRDRNEAAYIKSALSSRNIGAVFLSRDSVFDTLVARELALVLLAIANPKDERALRGAMATALLGYDAQAIHGFNLDEDVRQQQLEAFDNLHQTWLKRGIMPCMMALAADTRLIERLLAGEEGQRRLTDFRHLGELLQQKAMELDGISALLNWYQQTLIEQSNTEESQLRLESEQNLVQIVTIHKSKGLEYPICFLPFVSLARDNRRKPAPMLYHDQDALVWDITQTDEGWAKYKAENLAEDLRLLYVALTRPVLACYCYIANHSRFTKRDGISSQLFETAIGYLLGIESKACEFADIQAAAEQLISEDISVDLVHNTAPKQDFEPLETAHELTLAPRALTRRRETPWRVGSYSGLVKHSAHEQVSPGMGDEAFPELEQLVTDSEQVTRFSFERGANAGSFLHWVLEQVDFTDADTTLRQELPKAMDRFGIDEQWQAMLHDWYLDLLHTPLDGEQLRLARLSPAQKLVEMEFYMPIGQLDAAALNQLLCQYGYSSGLNFDTLQGMLKGFIDLTFEYQGKFYIADYKSNHLGDHLSHYDNAAMARAIVGHHYDLQYIIYSLALHRYLKLRLPGYQYELHVGGCYYLFLRGMSAQSPQTGVYYDKPPFALIDTLDTLLSQKSLTASQADFQQGDSLQADSQQADLQAAEKPQASRQTDTPPSPAQGELDL
ncbi:exodeoxyribonuclease V subunit beta [Shewanella sp. Isolate7]|uniref:exodeoxyribonuclease V subunit beta n=1 Tax=Shewanella sp. Isolate7 TaxID=2908528 RepID=UPI001EFDF4A4|nr:exodeoxyribonuclease V subunit beta [Shewanella sp. Isolate7]MCG9722555.1 exodeoxyribonuclease V subunit beta [Shewanella sp. Isolate7]